MTLTFRMLAVGLSAILAFGSSVNLIGCKGEADPSSVSDREEVTNAELFEAILAKDLDEVLRLVNVRSVDVNLEYQELNAMTLALMNWTYTSHTAEAYEKDNMRRIIETIGNAGANLQAPTGLDYSMVKPSNVYYYPRRNRLFIIKNGDVNATYAEMESNPDYYIHDTNENPSNYLLTPYTIEAFPQAKTIQEYLFNHAALPELEVSIQGVTYKSEFTIPERPIIYVMPVAFLLAVDADFVSHINTHFMNGYVTPNSTVDGEPLVAYMLLYWQMLNDFGEFQDRNRVFHQLQTMITMNYNFEYDIEVDLDASVIAPHLTFIFDNDANYAVYGGEIEGHRFSRTWSPPAGQPATIRTMIEYMQTVHGMGTLGNIESPYPHGREFSGNGTSAYLAIPGEMPVPVPAWVLDGPKLP